MTDIRNPDGVWINSSEFTKEAQHFQQYGYYTADNWGTKGWQDYWTEQLDRCINGYSVGGAKITGHHYAYLNFTPIKRVNFDTGRKIVGPPDFWDGDYNFFWGLEIARNGISKEDYENLKLYIKIKEEFLKGNYHFIIAKARRKGYSYKVATILANAYNTIRNSLSLVGAYEDKYASDTMRKVTSVLDFYNEFTGWKKNRDAVNRKDHLRASFLEKIGGTYVERGYKSEIQKVIYKDNPDASRGKDAYYSIIDEAGVFGNPGLLKSTIEVSKPSLEAGEYLTGQMILFGCVCAGTKVWNNDGKMINIEDLHKSEGILGFNGKSTIRNNISWLKPPAKKHCYRIITASGKSLECSYDHPILWSNPTSMTTMTKRKTIKTTRWKAAEDIKKGDHVLIANSIPYFGRKRMIDARLIGMLIGDGSYSQGMCRYVTADDELFNYVADRYDYSIYDTKMTRDGRIYRDIGIKKFIRELRKLGLENQTGKDKRLPDNIDDYNKKDLADLIGGLIDTDGYVGINPSYTSPTVVIKLTSVSKELLEQVRYILLKFGVHAVVYYERSSDIYRLIIKDIVSITNFRKNIKLLVPKKQKTLDDIIKLRKVANHTENFVLVDSEIADTISFDESDIVGARYERVKEVYYIGKRDVYNLTADDSHTYIANGFITHNTSGDMDSGTVDFADIFQNPDSYGFMPFVDVWDEDMEDHNTGFFHPVYWNKEGYYDKNGNSDITTTIKSEMAIRESIYAKSKSREMINKRAAEYPLNPTEAFAINNNNDFPVPELQRRLSKVLSEKIHLKKGQPTILERDEDGNVTAIPDIKGLTVPLYEFIKYEDTTGTPVIYEQPVKGAPKGTYIIGYDPYRQDEGTSLGSAIVYKTSVLTSPTHDTIVAEYVARPSTFDEYNRTLVMLAEYYSATIMYENEVPEVKAYFATHRKLHLLETQPDDAIKAVIKSSKVNRVYGMHMTVGLLDAGEKYLKAWLLEERDYIDGKPILNLDTIDSPGLLKELIKYSRRLNTDRVSSFYMIMFYLSQKHIEHGSSLTYKANSTIKQIKSLLNKF